VRRLLAVLALTLVAAPVAATSAQAVPPLPIHTSVAPALIQKT
jgi:hypothetical protein